MKTLITNRIELRKFTEDDLYDFYEYASVKGVGEDAGWVHHQSIEESRDILKNFIAGNNEYAIVYRENKKVIGSLGIYDKLDISIYENNHQKEIGFCLSKDYWGKGLMTEAVKRVLSHLFDDLEVYAIWCSHFDFNNRSRRVIEKCGFKYIKEETNHVTRLKKTYVSYVYRLLNKEYQAQKLEEMKWKK